MKNQSTAVMFREVAQDIRDAASRDSQPDGSRFSCKTRHGTRLRCNNEPAAIARLIAQYEKAAKRFPAKIATRISTIPGNSRPISSTINECIADLDFKTAVELSKLNNKPIYFYAASSGDNVYIPLQNATVYANDDRFCLGRRLDGQWAPTHIRSGRLVAIACTSQTKASYSLASKIKEKNDTLDLLLSDAACDFQNKAIQFYEHESRAVTAAN